MNNLIKIICISVMLSAPALGEKYLTPTAEQDMTDYAESHSLSATQKDKVKEVTEDLSIYYK